jgi:hypothetical protein
VNQYLCIASREAKSICQSACLRRSRKARPIPGSGAAATTTVAIRQLKQDKTPYLARIPIMALPQSAYKDRQFLAVIGDEVSSRLGLKQHASKLTRHRTL